LPGGTVDLLLVADREAPLGALGDEDRVAHLAARTLVLGLHFLPEADPAEFQLRQLFLDLAPQAVLLGFARALAAAWEHPQAVRPSPDQQNLAAFGGNQLGRLRHSSRKPKKESASIVTCLFR